MKSHRSRSGSAFRNEVILFTLKKNLDVPLIQYFNELMRLFSTIPFFGFIFLGVLSIEAEAGCSGAMKEVFRLKYYEACDCKGEKISEKALAAASEVGMTIEAKQTYFEPSGEKKLWYQCSLVFRYRDRKMKEDPDCEHRDLIRKLDAIPEINGLAQNFSFVMCSPK